MATTEPISDLPAVNALLGQRRGAQAKIWQFHPSLGRMAIQVMWPREPQQLYLICVNCARMTGPFVWEDCQIEVLEESHQGQGTAATRLVRDRAALFELRCNSVVLVQSAMGDFSLYE